MADYDFLFKIVVIGDSGVGKTNLVSQFIDQQYNDNQKSTIGVEFSSKTTQVEGVSIRSQIWDTAGQQRFQAVTKAYYNGSVGAIVAFDLTNSKSFNSIRRWIDEVENHTNKETFILLIGNKIDLGFKQIDHSKIEQIAKQKNLIYIETSAKTGQNVDEAFNTLIENIYRSKLKQAQLIVKQEPKSFKKMEEKIPTKENIEENQKSGIIVLDSKVDEPLPRKKKKCSC